jgi:hypothetical protein
MEVQTLDISPQMKKVIQAAIDKAQRIKGNKDGAYYLDFYREIETKDLPEQYIDIEIHIDAHLIDLIKCDEVYFSDDVTQFATTKLDGYRKWSDLMKSTFKGYILNDINVF